MCLAGFGETPKPTVIVWMEEDDACNAGAVPLFFSVCT